MKFVYLNEIKNNLSKISNTNYLVLKSDAYGFGLKEILKIIKKTDLYKFCVINLEDGITIRRKIINAKILLITPFNESLLPQYKKYKVELSVHKIEDFNLIKDTKINYQVAINSGMNRFGLKGITIEMLEHENITGIYSHNATEDISFIQKQINFFDKITKKDNIDIHYFSSQHKNMSYGNCRRIGEDIYLNSLEIKANIIHYIEIKKGEYLGYDFSFKAPHDMLVGILDIGYADGLIRNCNGFKVYSNCKYYDLLGKCCMNHSFVRIDSKNVTEVEIISIKNPIQNYAKYFKVSIHEIFISYSLSTNIYKK